MASDVADGNFPIGFLRHLHYADGLQMDIVVFKKFFESLSDLGDQVRGKIRTKSAVSLTYRILLGYLRVTVKGENDLGDTHQKSSCR
jgi:hypothetical protein